MMDSASYASRTLSKLQLYTSFQIIPSIQLITTYETPEHPLNTETARAGAAVFPIKESADGKIWPFCLSFSACPILHHSPTRIIKNIGQKCVFFSTVPKNRRENPGISLDFPVNWAYTAFFSVYAQKSLEFWA